MTGLVACAVTALLLLCACGKYGPPVRSEGKALPAKAAPASSDPNAPSTGTAP